jgi:hypothetical protein
LILQKVKKVLAHHGSGVFKITWEWAISTLSTGDFAAAYYPLTEANKKCLKIEDGYVAFDIDLATCKVSALMPGGKNNITKTKLNFHKIKFYVNIQVSCGKLVSGAV